MSPAKLLEGPRSTGLASVGVLPHLSEAMIPFHLGCWESGHQFFRYPAAKAKTVENALATSGGIVTPA